MRLTLIIGSLNVGGAERVVSIMANYWAAKGWDITLITFGSDQPAFYELHPKVHYVPLAPRPLSNFLGPEHCSVLTRLLLLAKAIWNNLLRILDVRYAVQQSHPQVVVSFCDIVNIVTILATRGLNVPVLVSERTIPTLYSIGKFWDTLQSWTYPKAHRLVVQSAAVQQAFFPRCYRITSIIPNPLNPALLNMTVTPKTHPKAQYKLLGLGRMIDAKGFDLLIQAFAQIAKAFSDWSLDIWGEGPERATLETLIDELGLQNRVRLPGLTTQPFEVMQSADLFVLSSRFEGFPNVLLEAMGCGLPVISFDCPYGPREIIRDGIDGILVAPQNVEELTAAMSQLMQDHQRRHLLSIAAQSVHERFHPDKVMQMWEAVLSQLVESPGQEKDTAQAIAM